MNQFERICKTENAQNVIQHITPFEQPILDFVLYDERNGHYKIGFIESYDYEQAFMIESKSEKTLIRYEEITYQTAEEYELLEDCIEGYILHCLCNDEEVVFMSIDMHIFIWMYIDGHLNVIDPFQEKGIINYLTFCLETGITRRLIETYGRTLFPDLFSLYLHKQDTISAIMENSIRFYELSERKEHYGQQKIY